MSEIYTVIVGILGILAISGLFVGVTNDAVNFLNSAIGSKAASMRVILLVATAGILIGVITSSGMMEVARNGMFDPGLFTFHEVMMLYLGVMFANIILLDLYNSWGLPTSTTVSLIFCLLGSAIAVSIYKIAGDPAQGVSSLGQYINTSRAMGIVSAILLSVVIAFTCGTLVMYISRMIFSFRYTALFRRYGSLWCGASLTAIVYFAVFKGLKSILADHAFIQLIDNHLPSAIAICWVVCSLLLFFIQRFKVNILRITILSGTFSLALAFAGNDLVNFIGVPMASYDALQIARDAGSESIMMDGLANPARANFLILLASGLIMVLTLFFSKKSRHVAETELSLASQHEESERFGSTYVSRSLVRATLLLNNLWSGMIPARVQKAIDRRFEPLPAEERTTAQYDMIRAVVNLTAASILIAIGTSYKLPLSTTYVVFMVAMGSSLADKAWGRESAVYRITGVMTVIVGWFSTAIGGFIIALATGLLLIWGGNVAFVIITVVCLYMLLKSNFSFKAKKEPVQQEKVEERDAVDTIVEEVCRMMKLATQIYDRTLVAVFKENRKALKELIRESDDIYEQSRKLKYSLMPTLRRLIDARGARPPEALMTTFQQAETGFIEALVSIYEPACLPFFEEARARNLRQLNLVIPEKLQSRVVYTRAEALPFFNINFPGELEQARRMAEAAREQRHSTACHASEEGIR